MCGGRKKQFVVARIYDKRGRILSEATNSYIKTDPMFAMYAKRVHRPMKEYVHAEALAVFRLKFVDRKRAHTIRVYRFGEDGFPRLAEPCPVCQEIIKLTNIKEIYFTTENNPLDMDFAEYKYIREHSKFWYRN